MKGHLDVFEQRLIAAAVRVGVIHAGMGSSSEAEDEIPTQRFKE